MDWYVVDKEYINYLKQFDSKVGYVEYGSKLKLHLGIVMKVQSLDYYVPISSPKSKHENMSNSLDFQKIQEENGQLYAVLNLNNMIPVPMNCIKQVKYDEIDLYRKFKSNKEKTDYIYLLQKEKKIIDSIQEMLYNKAKKLYAKCINNPNSALANRCCNFLLLEEKAQLYRK